MNKKYDIAIIGSGPGGYVAAIRAAMLQLSVCLIEKEELGGVCLNWGCIPTKVLLKSAHLLQELKGAVELGININEFAIDFNRITQRKENVVRNLQNGIAYLLKKRGVDVIKGQAKIKDINNLEVNNQKINFRYCVIATGSRPADLPLFKIDEQGGILSNKGMLSLEEIPKSLLIIGGGAIGCEFADIFRSLGSEVTIIELTNQLLPNEDAEAVHVLKKELEKRGIKIFTNTKITAVTKKTEQGFDISLERGDMQSAQKILVSIGRISNSEDCGIENIGIKLDKFKIIVNDFMQTNISNFYAIGDVVGKSYLAHVASREGIVAVENIANGTSRMNYNYVPRCVYTRPEIASVGLTQNQVQAKGMKAKIGKFPFSACGKAVIEKATLGMVKFIVDDKQDTILGASLCGRGACEIVHEVAVAMQAGLKISQLSEIIHAHPTISESIMEAAAAVNAQAIHII